MLTEQSLAECNQAGFQSSSLVTWYGMPDGCVHYQLHAGLPLRTFARCSSSPQPHLALKGLTVNLDTATPGTCILPFLKVKLNHHWALPLTLSIPLQDAILLIYFLCKRTTAWYYSFVNINKTLCNESTIVISLEQNKTIAAAALEQMVRNDAQKSEAAFVLNQRNRHTGHSMRNPAGLSWLDQQKVCSLHSKQTIQEPQRWSETLYHFSVLIWPAVLGKSSPNQPMYGFWHRQGGPPGPQSTCLCTSAGLSWGVSRHLGESDITRA